jgi:hypothetical protein
MTNKTRNIIVVTSIALLFIIGIVFYGRVLWFFETLKYVQSFLANKLDINKNIIIAISFPIALFYFKFGILNLFSIKKSKQWIGLIVHSVLMMVFYISMFLFPKDSIFDPFTGESIQCFTRYEGKLYKVECDWTVHETFGTPVFKPNEETIREWRKQQGLDENNNTNDPYKILEKTESKYKSLE